MIHERSRETSRCPECRAELIVEEIDGKVRFVPRAECLSREEIRQRDEDREYSALLDKQRRRQKAQEWEDIAKGIFILLVLIALVAQCASPPQGSSDRDYCPGPDRYC